MVRVLVWLQVPLLVAFMVAQSKLKCHFCNQQDDLQFLNIRRGTGKRVLSDSAIFLCPSHAHSTNVGLESLMEELEKIFKELNKK